MSNLDFQPKMVGREHELNQLQSNLGKASEGQGSMVFISGEAGIGKTRLVNELKRVAQSKGFQILSGNCMYESLTPFMPIMETLRSGGMESLFAEEAPKVEATYLVTHSGLLIKELVRQETKLDPDLFSSVLTTLSEFASQSLSTLLGEEQEGTLNSLGYENYRILIESRKDMNLVVILSGKENEFLINDMRDIFSKVNKSYKNVLEDWDGDEDNVKGIEKFLEPLITSGKYDGIYYGKEDPKARRNLLFENVSMGLARSSQTSPTLLCIEDLQWVDPSSLALMHYLARNTKESGLFILGTYRPEDVAAEDGKGHPLLKTMQLMDREDLYEKMELERLSEDSINEFLFALLGKSDLTDDFKNKIYKETEGNPLFVIELVKYLVDEDIIKNFDGTWKLTKPLEEGAIPSKVYNVISRRLNRVERDDRKVLDYASIIGEAFDSNLLAAILNMNRVQLLERLRYLEQTHRLIHPQNGNFKFDHAKIKEVLYSEIPKELGREYHLEIANTLETLNKDNLDEVVGDLAFHFYQSKNKEKALFYLSKAAEKAKKDYANEEAIKFYNFAFELEKDTQKRMFILENQGDIYDLMGDYEKCINSFKGALELAQEKRKKTVLIAKIGGICEKQRKFDDAIKYCNEALDMVKGEDCKEEALALDILGNIYTNKGEYDKAIDCFNKSLKISEKIGDEPGVATTLTSLGLMHEMKGEFGILYEYLMKGLKIFEKISYLPGLAKNLTSIGIMHERLGDFDIALEYLEKGLNIYEKTGDKLGSIQPISIIGDVHHRRGEFDYALKWLEKGWEIAEKTGESDYNAIYFNTIGYTYNCKGEFEKAFEYCQKNVERAEKIGSLPASSAAIYYLGYVYLDTDDYNKAAECFDKSMEISQKIGTPYGTVSNYMVGVILNKRIGDYDKAVESLNKGLEILEMMQAKWALAYTYSNGADLYFEMRDFEKALDLCNRSLDLAHKIKSIWIISEAKKIFGKIYREQEKWNEAIENFEQGISGFEKSGMIPEVAKSHYEFGLMWKAKGEPEKAEEHLNKALDIFEKLKVEKRTEIVKMELEKLS